MGLNEVIGIEIQRASLNEKMTEEGKRDGLVVDPNQASGFELVRSFSPEAVRFTEIQTRMSKGGRASAMTVVPRGSGPYPAVFLLDEECRHLQFPGIVPEEMRVDEFEGRFYARIPLVSHLVGAGFAAAVTTRETLSKESGAMTVRDWIALVQLFESKPTIDPESLFLVATQEFAELALRLAVRFRFAGVVIEAPRDMMFVEAAARAERKKQTAAGNEPEQANPDDGDGQTYFQSESHMIFYAEHGRAVNAPILVVLAKEAPEFDQTRKTLLAAFVAGKAELSAVLLDRWARTRAEPGGQTDTWMPGQEGPLFIPTASKRPNPPVRMHSPFEYDSEQFSRWIGQMTIFLTSHAEAKPMALPRLQQEASVPGRGGLDDAFDRIVGEPATDVDRFGNEVEEDPNLPEPDSPY